MKFFFLFLLKHKWAIILAILIGLILTAPQIVFRIINNDIYQGIGLVIPGSDEGKYFMRIQEVRDGYYSVSSYATVEGKDAPYLAPSLPEILNSSLGSIFGLDLVDTAILARFFFPILIFLFLYFLLYQLVSKKSIALIISITVLLSTNLVGNEIWNLFLNPKIISNNFLTFARICIPSISSLFFFFFLLSFWVFFKKNNWFYGVISGIVLGLTFYIYPYTWTFIFAFLGCLGLIFAITKQWNKVKNIFLIYIIAFLVAIPYFLNLWKAINHPFYSEVSLRFSMVEGHTPQLGIIAIILLFVFLLFFSRQQKKRYHFCLALILAPLVVLNQQIITGHVLAPAHYHWYFHKPLIIIFLMIIIFEQIEKRIIKLNLKKICWSGLITIILFVNFYNAWVIQYNSYKVREKISIDYNQRYGSMLNWLKENIQKDKVVIGTNAIDYFIPMYTSLNSITADDAHYTLAVDEYGLLEKAFLEFRLNKWQAEDLKKYIFNNRVMISGRIYGQQYRRQGGYELIPDEKLNFIVSQYEEFLFYSLEDMLIKYRVDYLVWDIKENPQWDIDQYQFFKQIYEIGDIKIYKLI